MVASNAAAFFEVASGRMGWRLEAVPELIEFSAVGLAAVADGGDPDSVLVLGIEEYTVVATAEAKAGERRLKLFHVAGASGQAAIQAVENLHGSFTVDCAQIGAGFGRPDDGDPLGGRGRRSLVQAELAEDLFVRDSFTARERGTGAGQRVGGGGREFFLFHRS